MYSEETKASGLAKLLSNFDLVLLDTCSLMEDSFPLFMDALVTSHGYWKEGLRVVILGECMAELKKHSKSGEHEKRINAKRALKIVKHDQSIWNRNKVLKIEKALHKDAFADRAIFAKVSDLRISQKILVITQDKKLKADIRGLNNLESQKGRNIHVYQIGRSGELEIKFDDRSAPVPARNFNGKKNVEKPERKPVEEKPKAPQKPKNPDKPQVILKENALLANLNNPNYPVNKKLDDIANQIALLKGLSEEEKKQLNLKLTEEKLLAEKKKLEAPKPKEKEPAQKKPAKEQPAPKQEAPAKAKPYYEYGKTPSAALKRLGDHYGWMFRDSTVAFFAGVHGPVDLTTDDLALSEGAADLKPETSKEIKIKSLTLVFERTKNEFHVYLKPVEEKKQEPKPEAKPEPEKAKKPAKKKETKKVEEPAKEEAPKQEPKPKKAKKKAPTKVEEPKKEEKKEPEAKKAKAPKTTKKTSLKAKKEEKPAAEPVVAEKPKKPSKKAPAKKEKEPAKPAEKAEVKRSSGFAEAEKNDKILNANLNNPNYPKASAIKDIEEQIVRIRHLKPGESKELKFGIKALQAKLKELK